jgi:hypothetical protein
MEAATKFKVTKEFVLAGKAIFTVHNNKGNHYTYQVKKARKDHPIFGPTWYVYLLTGPDNTRNYTYIGVLDPQNGQWKPTQASKLSNSATSISVLNWAMSLVWNDQPFPDGYGCHGEGRCGRCGRRLTDEPGVNPEAERYGFGPVCYQKITGQKAKRVSKKTVPATLVHD